MLKTDRSCVNRWDTVYIQLILFLGFNTVLVPAPFHIRFAQALAWAFENLQELQWMQARCKNEDDRKYMTKLQEGICTKQFLSADTDLIFAYAWAQGLEHFPVLSVWIGWNFFFLLGLALYWVFFLFSEKKTVGDYI